MRLDLPEDLYGLLYDGTAATLAPLIEALNATPALTTAPWWRLAVEGGGHLLLTQLEAEGLRPTPTEALRGEPFAAAHLFEALPLIHLPGEPAAEEACLWAPRLSADPLVERLLRLGRGDAMASAWRDFEGDEWFVARLPRPPLYVLMRSRDTDEGIAAYTRAGAADLWIAWGYTHPLLDVALDWVARMEQRVFIDPDGRWRTLEAEIWPERGLYELVDGALPAPRQRLEPAEGDHRFQVRLRLEPGPLRPSTLWLMDAEGLISLERFIEQTPPKALGRLSIQRFLRDGRSQYVLKERAHGKGQAPLGPALDDLLGRGYTSSPGLDTLYLPTGARLSPQLQIPALRALFELDEGPVIVTHDPAAGIHLLQLTPCPEEPLSKWVDFVLLERRQTLEAFMEASLFRFRSFGVPGAVKRSPAPPPPPKPRAVKQRRPRPKPQQEARAQAHADEDAAALFVATLPLKARIQEGGCDEPEVWSELGELLERLGEREDAAFCLEAALFYGPRAPALADRLARLRAASAGLEDTPEAQLEAATSDHLTRDAAGYVGARLVAELLAERPVMEGLEQQIQALFEAPTIPRSARLSWMTHATAALDKEDKLALTRAKERTLGRLNADGLSSGRDTPRFVQLALALEGGEAAQAAGDQGEGLKLLWGQVEPTLEELDAQSLLYRALFAVGFARVGALDAAKGLMAEIEEEVVVHDPPVRAAARLYLAQLAEDAEVALGALEPKERRALDVLRNRSRWLSVERPTVRAPARWINALLNQTEAPPTQRLSAIADPKTMARQRAYDWELAWSGRILLEDALRGGDEREIIGVLDGLKSISKQISIQAHLAEVLAEITTAAAALDQSSEVDRALERLAQISGVVRVGDLLRVLEPTMAALRRVGAADAARGFFEQCLYAARGGQKGGTRLLIFVADGHALMGGQGEASGLLEEALREITTASMDHVTRYEAARHLAETLQLWAPSERITPALRLLSELHLFRDTFSSRIYFDAHKILLMEHLIEALSDRAQFKNRQVQLWLELEEQAIRRQILSDWRSV